MKNSLVLHIGMGKTGTTALQNFFWNNRKPLAKNGISYPKYGAVSGAHHLFSPHIPEVLQGIWEFLPAEIWAPKLAKAGAKKTLLSSELMAWADDRLVREFCTSLGKWFDLTVVIYLRRQDNIIMASYMQNVKMGKQKRRIIDIYQNMLPKFNYESILRPWEESVGVRNIIVRPYESQQFYSQDIRRDFMHHVFGLDVSRKYTLDNNNPNPRLSRTAGEYKRLINNVVEDQDKRQKLTVLLKQFSEEIGHDLDSSCKNHALLPPDIRLRIIEDNDEINSTIAEKYLGKNDGVLFQDQLPDSSMDWPGNELSQDEAAVVSGYLQQKDLQLTQWFSQELEKSFDVNIKPQKYAAQFLAATL